MNGRRWLWGGLAATLIATAWAAFDEDAPTPARRAAPPAGARSAEVLADASGAAAGVGAVAPAGERAGAPSVAGSGERSIEGPNRQPDEQAADRQADRAPEPAADPPPRPEPNTQTPNLFASYSWQPPPPPAPAAAPAKPGAPPLPFTYAGRLVEGGQTAYLLLDQTRIQGVSAGAQVGDYTLESASDAQLVFLHRPTGERQSLAIAPQASAP